MISLQNNQNYLNELASILDNTPKDSLYQTIVDSPFKNKLRSVEIDLGIVVLCLVNPNTQTIDRIALSKTELAVNAVKVSMKRFHEIKIPVQNKQNILAKAINSGKIQQTSDWKYLFIPELDAADARLNQASAGIGCSIVVPLASKAPKGAIIFSFFQPESNIDEHHYTFVQKYSEIVSATIDKHLTS
jgi:hypothetical protein